MGNIIFTVDDLRKRYSCKTDGELAELLILDKSNISYWRKAGIPKTYQRLLFLESALPASRKKLPATA